jgi:SAM-dependent methyltransferase
MTGFVKTTKDFGDATAEIVRRGWPLHIWNHLKNWDSTWLDTVMKDGDLLDIGCVTSMPLEIARHLNLKGRKVGIDPLIVNAELPHQVRGSAEDIPFSYGSFDFVTCLSVIEHGVNLDKFVFEMTRVLRRGGKFVITFDFWPWPKGNGLSWKELEDMLDVMRVNGLQLEPIDRTIGEPVVDGMTFGCVRGCKL